MSTQIKINENLIKYLQKTGYRSDPIIDQLEKATSSLGGVAQMQIAKEQGQFLEIITKISNTKTCLEIGRFTGMSTLFLARGLPSTGKIITVDNSDEFLSLAQKYWSLDNVSVQAFNSSTIPSVTWTDITNNSFISNMINRNCIITRCCCSWKINTCLK